MGVAVEVEGLTKSFGAATIWQDVTLIAVPTSYIEQVHITTDIYTGRVDLTVTLTGDLTTLNGELGVAIEGADAQATVKLEAGQPQSCPLPGEPPYKPRQRDRQAHYKERRGRRPQRWRYSRVGRA